MKITLLSIVAWAVIFTLVGHYVPIIYYKTASVEGFVHYTNFTAEDVYEGVDNHFIRTHVVSNRDMPAVVVRELHSTDHHTQGRKQWYSITHDILIEKQNQWLDINVPLPTNLPPGEYCWIFGITIELPDKVYRTFTIESEPFMVLENDGQKEAT